MNPYQMNELINRWSDLLIRMTRVIAALKLNVHTHPELNARKEMVKLSYHHAWIETNLKNIEPARNQNYADAKNHLDDIERDVNEHLEECRQYI